MRLILERSHTFSSRCQLPVSSTIPSSRFSNSSLMLIQFLKNSALSACERNRPSKHLSCLQKLRYRSPDVRSFLMARSFDLPRTPDIVITFAVRSSDLDWETTMRRTRSSFCMTIGISKSTPQQYCGLASTLIDRGTRSRV